MVRNPLPTSFHAGIDPTVIALWMGHASVASTKPYIHADMTLKQQAGVPRSFRTVHPLGWMSGKVK
jgi:hypothetical protein